MTKYKFKRKEAIDKKVTLPLFYKRILYSLITFIMITFICRLYPSTRQFIKNKLNDSYDFSPILENSFNLFNGFALPTLWEE